MEECGYAVLSLVALGPTSIWRSRGDPRTDLRTYGLVVVLGIVATGSDSELLGATHGGIYECNMCLSFFFLFFLRLPMI